MTSAQHASHSGTSLLSSQEFREKVSLLVFPVHIAGLTYVISGISRLIFEWIIRGELLKMKPTSNPGEGLVLPAVGSEIRAQTTRLNPKSGTMFYPQTEKYADHNWGLWSLEQPERYDENAVSPGTQVTTGLPIEGVYYPTVWEPCQQYSQRDLIIG
jgi:hypothetical protein